MHRLVIPCEGLDVDHINHNGIDNRKENLRVATTSQNLGNVTKYRGATSSSFKGVHWNKANSKWRASIRVERKLVHLGCFHYEQAAAFAYNQAALEHFGAFAVLNSIALPAVTLDPLPPSLANYFRELKRLAAHLAQALIQAQPKRPKAPTKL